MRRRLLTILIFLLAGAVVNVAVAWGCAAWVNIGRPVRAAEREARVTPDHYWQIERLHRVGALRIASSRRAEHSLNYDFTEIHVPHWSELASVAVEFRANGIEDRLADARGWPVLSMCCHIDFDYNAPPSSFRSNDGIILAPYTGVATASVRVRALPLRPIWRGFALNTIFYALILWLPICGWRDIRRLIRRKRGLCPACGYDLRHADHDTCPECGQSCCQQ